MQLLPKINQDPWEAREDQYRELETGGDRLRFLLNYAVLAPSRLNTQPWLFSVFEDRVDLYADRRRALAVADPNDRQMVLACGGALEFLAIAVRRFGCDPMVRVFPDLDQPDLLASLKVGRAVQPESSTEDRFRAIQQQRAQFAGLDPTPVSADVIEALKAEQQPGRTSVLFLEGALAQSLSELIREALAIQASDDQFRRELDSWTHPSRRNSRDGVPRPGTPKTRATAGEVAEGSPLFAVVTSRNDSHACWLRAGRALARMLLSATHLGLAARYLSHPLEIPALRERVTEQIAPGRAVQAIVRLGYSGFVRSMPRRPVREVLTS